MDDFASKGKNSNSETIKYEDINKENSTGSLEVRHFILRKIKAICPMMEASLMPTFLIVYLRNRLSLARNPSMFKASDIQLERKRLLVLFACHASRLPVKLIFLNFLMRKRNFVLKICPEKSNIYEEKYATLTKSQLQICNMPQKKSSQNKFL